MTSGETRTKATPNEGTSAPGKTPRFVNARDPGAVSRKTLANTAAGPRWLLTTFPCPATPCCLLSKSEGPSVRPSTRQRACRIRGGSAKEQFVLTAAPLRATSSRDHRLGCSWGLGPHARFANQGRLRQANGAASCRTIDVRARNCRNFSDCRLSEGGLVSQALKHMDEARSPGPAPGRAGPRLLG